MVSHEYTKAEIELLLKTAVDAPAAELGLASTVHVHLYECRFVNNKQNRKTRALREVSIENHGVGRIICTNGAYCAALLRSISSTPVSIPTPDRTEVLRVSMAISARGKATTEKGSSRGAVATTMSTMVEKKLAGQRRSTKRRKKCATI